MISVSVNVNDKLTGQIKKIKQQLRAVPAQAHTEFVALTPVDTGNARRKTKLVSNKTIEANYPYAQRLDQGWSKQAPKGIVKPWELWFRKIGRAHV